MKKLMMIGTAVAALTAASAASAATTVTQCGSGPSCVINFDGAAGTFGNADVVNTPFTDSYAFDVGTGLLSVTLSSLFTGAVGGAQDINFNLVQLNAPTGGFTAVPLIPTTNEFYSIQNVAVSAGQYVLRLQGSGASNLNASYSGTLNFSAATGAVPEPATWAMMLAGFGMVGFAMRRRQSKVATKVSFAL